MGSSEFGLRTYIPEPKFKANRRWTDKNKATQRVVLNNRGRTKCSKSVRLQRRRNKAVLHMLISLLVESIPGGRICVVNM